MTRHGGGVFRRLLHVIPDDDARTIDFDVVELWIASCGAACVVLGDPDTAERTPCDTCFPNGLPNSEVEERREMGLSKQQKADMQAAALDAAKNGDLALARKIKAVADMAEESSGEDDEPGKK